MIEIKDLVKTYGEKTAVDHLSLTIEPGKIYGFLGPNGAGKSTTMNIMTGYIAASSGSVVINGHDIFKEPEEAKKCIGYLPELPPLYTDMTVEEYLKFAAELKQIPKADRAKAVKEAMTTTRIMDVKGRLIRNLSKGYKQRVGCAQAILGMPDIIILDEPTVGLDPQQIIEIRELIKKLGEKHTVILSSHILTEISAVCDHVFIISHGHLVASDSTENLLAESKSGKQQTIELTVKGNHDLAVKALKEIGEIDKYEEKESSNNEISFTIHAKKDADVRERVFRSCVAAGLTILEMHTELRSLEDVFLELTGAGATRPVATASKKKLSPDAKPLAESLADSLFEDDRLDAIADAALKDADAENTASDEEADKEGGNE